MRLLQLNDNDRFCLTEFFGSVIPPYAILSHTWELGGDEVSFNNITKNTGNSKAGYEKLRFCGNQAKKEVLQYFWWILVASTNHIARSSRKPSILCTNGTVMLRYATPI